jgi:hypothetical protein
MAYVCDCSCHLPNSAEMHFVPCCDGECPYCGRYFVGLKRHKEEAHKDAYGADLAFAKSGRKKRRWTAEQKQERGY